MAACISREATLTRKSKGVPVIMTLISTEVSCGCAELLEISDLLSGISITDGVMISGFVSTTGSDSSSENCCHMHNELLYMFLSATGKTRFSTTSTAVGI